MSVTDLSCIDGLQVVAGCRQVADEPLPSFSVEAVNFLSELSQSLRHDSVAKRLPDVVSFAYWCRKANLKKLQEEYEGSAGNLSSRLGRGLAFHVTPTNVPVNFAFSFAFSLLAGNANVVRVPSKDFPQIKAVLSVMQDVLASHPLIDQRTAFVKYDAGSDATAQLSAQADVRVIWGGDGTISSIRELPCPPRCIDVAFADRHSFAVLNAGKVASLNEKELSTLVKNFYNDTYLMDQNACSSPHLLYWIGSDAEVQKAQDCFWGAVDEYARKEYPLQAASVMDKLVAADSDLIAGKTTLLDVIDGYLSIATTQTLDNVADKSFYRGKCGYFFQRRVTDPADALEGVTAKTQTITYFGIDPNVLKDVVMNLGLRGVDRIVPIGSAMDIGLKWDGYDLIYVLSRLVEAR